MKRIINTALTLLLALSLIAGTSVPAYSAGKKKSTKKKAPVSVEEMTPEEAAQYYAEQATGLIIVGDSRIVQMHEAVGDTGATFIAENSKGYDWFVKNAIPRIDPLVTKGTKVVICLGVNDPDNIDKYIPTVNVWAYNWIQRGANVYYCTVNPVWDNPYTTREEVDNFNARVLTGFPGLKIIDTYTYLTTTGYKMVDGMHFDSATNAKIYFYILSML